MGTTTLPLLQVAESLLLPALQPGVMAPASTPALALMTDYLVSAAPAIDASASLGEAERRLRDCAGGLLIVLDESPCVMGVLDARDLRGERATRTAPPSGAPRVADLAVRLQQLPLLSLAALATATPAQLRDALDASGRDHLLVVEPSGTALTGRLRGVVPRAQAFSA